MVWGAPPHGLPDGLRAETLSPLPGERFGLAFSLFYFFHDLLTLPGSFVGERYHFVSLFLLLCLGVELSTVSLIYYLSFLFNLLSPEPVFQASGSKMTCSEQMTISSLLKGVN